MIEHSTISFRVRDKGGPSGGKTLMNSALSFEITQFMKTPNAAKFVEKSYYAAVKKIIREIDEKKNGSASHDLASYESAVARSLAFTKGEIADWFATRDWSKVKNVPDLETKIPLLKEVFLNLSSRKNELPKKISDSIADRIIGAVADHPQDPIADFLFTILTTVRVPEDNFGFD